MAEIPFEERIKSNLDGILSLSQDNKFLQESIIVHQILILSKLYNKEVDEVEQIVYQEVLRKTKLTGIPNMIKDLQNLLVKNN